MNGFKFRDYNVYRQACSFRRNIGRLIDNLEKNRNFSLKDQLIRACDSIILNLAEGCSRKHTKDFSRYISFSIGSTNEVVACIDICTCIDYITADESALLVIELDEIAKQLSGLRRSSQN